MLRSNFDEVSKSIRSRCKPYEQLDEFEKIDTEFRKITTKIPYLQEFCPFLTNSVTKWLNK